MSRIGRLPVAIPSGVEINVEGLQGRIQEQMSGIDPSNPDQDVSFADGTDLTRVPDTTCGGPFSQIIVDVAVANEYRKRTVRLRYVDASCTEREGIEVAPGQEPTVSVQRLEVIRVYDAADSKLLSSWQATLNELGTDRIVLRSSSPDI